MQIMPAEEPVYRGSVYAEVLSERIQVVLLGLLALRWPGAVLIVRSVHDMGRVSYVAHS